MLCVLCILHVPLVFVAEYPLQHSTNTLLLRSRCAVRTKARSERTLLLVCICFTPHINTSQLHTPVACLSLYLPQRSWPLPPSSPLHREYALISHACLVRIKESHDEHFAHHPWKVDFDHYFKGPQRMIPPLLLEEVYAVSMLCSPLGKHDHEGGQDQGLTASVRAQNSAKRFFEVSMGLCVCVLCVVGHTYNSAYCPTQTHTIPLVCVLFPPCPLSHPPLVFPSPHPQNGLFNCSFTMRSSAAHRLMPGSVDHYCPACTKTKLTKPRGMGACGHIVCEQCLRGVMQKHHHGVHSIMAHALGGGGPEHVPCPLCKTRNATSQVMDMPAVGSWIAQQ